MSTIDTLRSMLADAHRPKSDAHLAVSAKELRAMFARATRQGAAHPPTPSEAQELLRFFEDLPASELDDGSRLGHRPVDNAGPVRDQIVRALRAPTSTAALTAPSRAASGTDPLQVSRSFPPNPRVRGVMKDLEKRCREGGAASMMFLPAESVAYRAWAFAYHTGFPKEMNLEKAPADGMVRGTIIVDPSGHNGDDALQQFARSNTYSVRIVLPDGRVLEKSGIPRNHPKRAEFATRLDIEFPYMSGVTEVSAWPDGSGGVGGYIEGRMYRVHSADKPETRGANAYDDF